MKSYYIYIMSNHRRTVLYVGMTNDLERRLDEHKRSVVKGFTSRYNCTELVYFEECYDVLAAIAREKQLKKWSRAKKEALISSTNPRYEDLSERI